MDRKDPMQLVSDNRDWLRAVALTSDATALVTDATVTIFDVSRAKVSGTIQ